jgi:hypothetical protein
MTTDSSPAKNDSAPLACDPNAVCAECGVFGAFDFDGLRRCEKCYAQKCACCAEAGKDE